MSASSSIGLQGKIAILALLPLAIWGAYRGLIEHRTPDSSNEVQVAIEHEASAGITVTHAIGGQAPFADIENENDFPIHISLPAAWERGEVKGAALSDVASDAPDFGFRRWRIPATSIVSFKTGNEWQILKVHNASPSLLKVRVITVDLATNTTSSDVQFVQQEDVTFSAEASDR